MRPHSPQGVLRALLLLLLSLGLLVPPEVHASSSTSADFGRRRIPTASFTFSPSTPQMGQVVTFNGSGSSGSDGDDLATWQWTFHDGTTASGEVATKTYYAAGTYSVRLTVTDFFGGTATTVRDVTVSGPSDVTPPSITITPSQGTFYDIQLPVKIELCDDTRIDSKSVTFNGNPVTSQFPATVGSKAGCGRYEVLQGTVTMIPGGNAITVRASDGRNPASEVTVLYTYVPVGGITVSTAPHNAENLDFAQFSATLGYSTPEYVSLDQPRAAGLFYSSAQADPKGFVRLEVDAVSAPFPERYSIRMKDANGAWVTNETFYRAGAGKTLLSAQWDAGHLATGIYRFTAVVRGWQGTQYREVQTPVDVLILNERQSVLGSGWSVAGLQRLHVTTGGVVITDGAGGIRFFRETSCRPDPIRGGTECEYAKPAGDFSGLRLSYDGVYTRSYQDGTYVRFTSTGLVSWVSDRFGQRTTFTYGTGGRLATITDPAGKTITFVYNTGGKLSEIRDPAGRVSRMVVNAAGDLTQITDPENVAALRPTYDSRHRVSYWLDRAGSRWDNTFDHTGSLTRVTAPTIVTNTGSVRPSTSTRSLAVAVLPAPDSGTAAVPATRVIPDAVRVSSTDSRGRTTRVAVDRFGAPIRIEDPRGKVQTITRNEHSQVRKTVAPTGHTVDYDWTGQNLTLVTDQTTGTKTRYTYTLDGQLQSQAQAEGNSFTGVFTNYYTGLSLDSTKVHSGSKVTRYTYDSRWRVKTVTDPEGHRTENFYATTGWMNTDSVKVAGRKVSTTYDAYGRVASTRSPLGQVSTVQYDLLNRTRFVTDPENGTTEYRYNGLGLHQVIDANAKTYVFERNALGWVTAETNPLGGTSRSTYNTHGDVVSTTNRRNQVVTMGHDPDGRLLWRDADGKRTTFTYDSNDRFVVTSNAESAADTMKLDAAGRLTSEVTTRNGKRFEVKSDWNTSWGARESVTALSGLSVIGGARYGFEAGRLTSIGAPGGYWNTISYNDDGQVKSIKLRLSGSAMLELANSYTSMHRLGSTTYNTTAANTAAGQGYRWDDLGRITEVQKSYSDTVRKIQYHPTGRLLSVTEYRDASTRPCIKDPDYGTVCEREGLSELGHRSYAYDKVGNFTGSGVTYDGANRLKTSGGYTFEYDADGNVTRKYKSGFEQTFTWNSLGELTRVVTNGTVAEYGYDGWGRRVRKTVGSQITRYVYDQEHVVLELNGAGDVLAHYQYYPGMDQPYILTRFNSGSVKTYYYLTDANGNVLGLADSQTGVVVNEYRYAPFGGLESVRETVPNPLRFAGREWDAETGLYFNRARYYDPAIGRFISEDPIGLAGGMNPYTYADNDPVNFRDPLGLYTDPVPYLHPGLIVVGQAGYGFLADLFSMLNRPSSRMQVFGAVPGGGGGGGGRPRVNAASPEPGKESRECTLAKVSFAGTLLLDLSFLTGVSGAAIYGIKGWRLGVAAARRGNNPLLLWESERAIAKSKAWAAGLFTVKNEVVGATWTLGMTKATGGEFGWGTLLDLVPGAGSYRSYQAMKEACEQ